MAMTFQGIRTLFTCPICAVQFDGDSLVIAVNVDAHQEPRMVEMWPGGPVFPDPSPFAQGRWITDHRWLATPACDDRFDLSDRGMWEMEWITWGDPPEVAQLMVFPKTDHPELPTDPRIVPGVR